MSVAVRTPAAVVLLSGGLDSTTTLAVAKSRGFAVHALTFRYGQRHSVELDCARKIVESAGVERHVIVDIDLRQFGGSALTGDLPVPKDRSLEAMSEGIPVSYVPARNTVFLSFALAWAEVLGAQDIFIGVNAQDHGGYPDCRPEFIAAFERLADLATKAGVEGTSRFQIHVPLIQLNKEEIIRLGLQLGAPFELTSTCYDPDPTTGAACGRCDACSLRLKGFAAVGVTDPIAYRSA